MTTTLVPEASRPATATIPIDHFDGPGLTTTPAAQLARIREQAPAFRAWFAATGRVDCLAARSLVTLPYPTRWALWEACSLRGLPYVWMTNRMFVVQWREGRRTRTLIAEPSDYELGVNGVSAPARDSRGRMVAAVSVTGPDVRLSEERIREIAPLLKDAATQLESALGHAAPEGGSNADRL